MKQLILKISTMILILFAFSSSIMAQGIPTEDWRRILLPDGKYMKGMGSIFYNNMSYTFFRTDDQTSGYAKYKFDGRSDFQRSLHEHLGDLLFNREPMYFSPVVWQGKLFVFTVADDGLLMYNYVKGYKQGSGSNVNDEEIWAYNRPEYLTYKYVIDLGIVAGKYDFKVVATKDKLVLIYIPHDNLNQLIAFTFDNAGTELKSLHYSKYDEFSFTKQRMNYYGALDAKLVYNNKGEEKVLIGVTHIDGGGVSFLFYDPNNGFEQESNGTSKLYQKFGYGGLQDLKLIQASMNGMTDAKATDIQVIITGSRDGDDRKAVFQTAFNMDTYSVVKKGSDNFMIPIRTSPIKDLDYIEIIPYYYPSDKNIQKELWLVTGCSDPHVARSTSDVRITRYHSDKLKLIEEKSDYPPDESGMSTIIGIVEGPPPYATNGKTIGEVGDASTFSYKQSQSTTNFNATDWGTAVTVGFSGAGEIFSGEAEITYAYKKNTSTETRTTIAQEITYNPVDAKTGLRFVVKPLINRKTYQLLDPSGRESYIKLFSFSMVGNSLLQSEYNLEGDLDPRNIRTYLKNNRPDQYPYLVKPVMRWLRGTSSTYYYSTDSTVEATSSHSLTTKVKVGILDIFSIGFKGSIAFTCSTKTSFSKDISIRVKSPDPRDAVTYPKDIKEFTFLGYLLGPRSDGYWVPSGYAGPAPWLATWKVLQIVNNDGTIETSPYIANSYIAPGKESLPANDEEIIKESPPIPKNEVLTLEQNYPNPFNPQTEIVFYLPSSGEVKLVIFDVTGNEVCNVLNGYLGEGNHRVKFTASHLPNGIYLYKLTSGGISVTKKMILMK